MHVKKRARVLMYGIFFRSTGGLFKKKKESEKEELPVTFDRDKSFHTCEKRKLALTHGIFVKGVNIILEANSDTIYFRYRSILVYYFEFIVIFYIYK